MEIGKTALSSSSSLIKGTVGVRKEVFGVRNDLLRFVRSQLSAARFPGCSDCSTLQYTLYRVNSVRVSYRLRSVPQANTKIDIGLTKIEVFGRSLLTFTAPLLIS